MLCAHALALFMASAASGSSELEAYLERVRDWTPRRDEHVLPIGLTDEEEEVLKRAPHRRSSVRSAARPPNPRMVPEWAPMRGVLIRYPLGISLDLVKGLSEVRRSDGSPAPRNAPSNACVSGPSRRRCSTAATRGSRAAVREIPFHPRLFGRALGPRRPAHVRLPPRELRSPPYTASPMESTSRLRRGVSTPMASATTR